MYFRLVGAADAAAAVAAAAERVEETRNEATPLLRLFYY